MAKRILGVIGLIGGGVAVGGVFLPWAIASALGISVSASGWDFITSTDPEIYCYLALVGGGIAALFALLALAAPKAKVLWALLGIGGAVAIAGAVWALLDIETGTIMGVTLSYGYGLYMVLGGGVLGLIGALGLLKG
jgi:hypothetical protein